MRKKSIDFQTIVFGISTILLTIFTYPSLIFIVGMTIIIISILSLDYLEHKRNKRLKKEGEK